MGFRERTQINRMLVATLALEPKRTLTFIVLADKNVVCLALGATNPNSLFLFRLHYLIILRIVAT